MNLTDISGKVRLNNGIEMPYLGLGLYDAGNSKSVESAINNALDAGYRLFDTASFYNNEATVGATLKKSHIARKDLFVTSKVWNSDQGYHKTIKAFEKSLHLSTLDYFDLYLIHWPIPSKIEDTWRALEKLYNDGKVRAIGVSNFTEIHLKTLLEASEIPPMLNQAECHPYLQQTTLRNFCKEHNIVFQSWAPLMRGEALQIGVIKCLAEKHGKSEAQIVLRWLLQKEILVIPKSVNKWRLFNNADIFTFELSNMDMRDIDNLDLDKRIGPDPNIAPL